MFSTFARLQIQAFLNQGVNPHMRAHLQPCERTGGLHNDMERCYGGIRSGGKIQIQHLEMVELKLFKNIFFK